MSPNLKYKKKAKTFHERFKISLTWKLAERCKFASSQACDFRTLQVSEHGASSVRGGRRSINRISHINSMSRMSRFDSQTQASDHDSQQRPAGSRLLYSSVAQISTG